VEKGAVIKKTVCRTADMINYILFVIKFETEVVFDYLNGFPGLGMVSVDVERACSVPCLVTVDCTIIVDHWSCILLFLSPSVS